MNPVDALTTNQQITFWNLCVAIAVCSSCSLVGCFLVLRGLSLLGDAISHAVLPGLVIGFMVSGTRDLGPMLVGAVIAGLLTTLLTQALSRRGQVEGDAGMGIVFTTMFALGVVLLSRFHSQVDLDPGCVLYGQLEASALDLRSIWGWEVPRQLVPLGLVFAVDVAVVLALWKELKITAFDPALATSLGISAAGVHYVSMTVVACTTVASFEAVGSILVIAMLIVPGATAHLLTDRLGSFVLVALVTSWLAAIGGYLLADTLDTNAAGMIAVAAGGLFAIAVVAAPQHGLAVRWIRRARLGLRIVSEDLLAHLYRYQERAERTGEASIPMGATELRRELRGAWLVRRAALAMLSLRRLVTRTDGLLQLTPAGLERARQVVRTHRLWESFLEQNLDLPLDHLHEPAHRMEHYLTPGFADQILENLDQPERDPHGRRIPGPSRPRSGRGRNAIE